MSITLEEFRKNPIKAIESSQSGIVVITDGKKNYVLCDADDRRLASYFRLRGTLKMQKSFEELKEEKIRDYEKGM